MKIYQEDLATMKRIVDDYTQETVDFEIEQTVQTIIQNVIKNGDQALKDYSKKFDQVDLDKLLVEPSELEAAYDTIDDDLKASLLTAKDNITAFHELEKETGFVDVSTPGIVRGQKLTALKRVGLYVPGGTAAYPSTILMNAIPSKIAGVQELVMITPPQKDGINPAVLAAAKIGGVDAVYQVGGAQGIAALAYGTETIPAVDKIVGPGNIFVATAKKQVFGQVAIDMVAGPSEIGILADANARPSELAADLLSQAEHDRRARAMLVTDSLDLAQAVSKEVDQQLTTLPRQEIAQAAINDRSFITVMPKVTEMFDLMNAIAPEHLEIAFDNPSQYLGLVENAGSVFLGRFSTEPLGDYLAGPNHVLPTGGTARFSSPLGVYDFVKRTQFLQYSAEQLANVADKVTKFARTEGLEAHARAIEARFKD